MPHWGRLWRVSAARHRIIPAYCVVPAVNRSHRRLLSTANLATIPRTAKDRSGGRIQEVPEKYIATRDLEVAVNAAVTLQRPLLVKGEPGTGKTILAHEVAASLDKPLIEWHVKSTTKAQQGLYEYDAVSRLRDGQLGDPQGA